MLGAINPADDQNVTAQMELAKAAGVIVYPNETLTPAASASISSAAESIMPEEDQTSDNNDGGPALSTGAIAGIAVGGTAAVALVGFLVFCLGRNRGQIKALKAAHNKPSAPPEMTVDGVTYVPTSDPRAARTSVPPSYHRFSPDLRSKSPETTISGPISGQYGPQSAMYSPSMGPMQNRFV